VVSLDGWNPSNDPTVRKETKTNQETKPVKKQQQQKQPVAQARSDQQVKPEFESAVVKASVSVHSDDGLILTRRGTVEDIDAKAD
jgi:hypothetical protein